MMLHIHQCSLCKLYMLHPDLYIADWLSHHSLTENRDQEITNMSICLCTINTVVDLSVCILIEDIRAAMNKDAELQMLHACMIGWTQNKGRIVHSLSKYWSIRCDQLMINDVALMDK